MPGQLIEKLKTFNWKDDKPRIWPSCKFGVQITAYCISVSFFMTICAAIVYGESAMGLLVCLLAVHFLSAIITVGELGEISSIQRVLMKIEPETDILSKSEQLKTRCILYACRVSLAIIAVSVGFELQFVLFSGAVFALSGAIFTCIFSYKVRKLFPREFIRVVSFHMWGRFRSYGKMSESDNRGFNPATGLPMISNSFDSAGNIYGSDFLQSNRKSTFSDNHMDEISAGVNPASGLPMMNDTFDINGDVFGTTSHFYDDHHHHNWDNHHSHYDTTWDNHWDSHDRW
ncbi:hypothetical protein F2I39_22210 [Escherichia coli]|nr:hypothetical protein [Citrobacter portucalensis]EFC1481711.1 hypothetical protein [Escherichia coli]EFE8233864.1 hypothetical protein [Escherichia coli]NUH52215.1 hypothetical protein [Citrobacter portucalensis]